MDSLMFMTESTKKINDDVKRSSGIPQNASAGVTEQTESEGAANDPDIVSSSMQRPVDLYKVTCVPDPLYTYWKRSSEFQVELKYN